MSRNGFDSRRLQHFTPFTHSPNGGALCRILSLVRLTAQRFPDARQEPVSRPPRRIRMFRSLQSRALSVIALAALSASDTTSYAQTIEVPALSTKAKVEQRVGV